MPDKPRDRCNCRIQAAVSKNLTDKYAEMEAKWMREVLTVSNEIGELKEHCISEHDCTFCGVRVSEITALREKP